MRFILENRIK